MHSNYAVKSERKGVPASNGMNILVFSLAYEPFVGGAEVALKEIANRLPHIRFDLLTLRFDSKLLEREEVGNIHIHRVGFSRSIKSISDTYRLPLSFNKYLFPLFVLSKMRKLLREREYSLTWSIMANYAGFAGLFAKVLYPKIPFLLTLQEGDPLEYIRKRVNIFFPIFKRIFRKADSVQAISTFLGQFAIDMGYPGVPHIIPNGVDLSLFGREFSLNELEAFKHETEKEMPVTDLRGKGNFIDEVRIVTVSRLVVKNGVGDLIAALKELPPYYRLIVIGDGPLFPFLKARVSELALDSRVLFLGQIPYEEMPKYLSIADVFVRPSLSEGMGNSFIEAMAAGLPVVGTPVGGIPDFLKDPFKNPDEVPTGIFCEPHNPKSIAEKVQYIADNKDIREELIKNGRVLAHTKYDWNLIAQRMEKEVFIPLAQSAAK